MATPPFTFNPSSQFNFEPSPSFSFSNPGVNPMMQPVALIGQQSVATPLPASQFDPSSSFNVQPSSSFNVQPTPSLNFNPAPSFSFSSPAVNPMMQPVSILDQQVFNTPQPAVNPMMQPVPVLDQQVFSAPQSAINFDPFSSFNVEPSPAFSFPDPVVNPMMQPVPVLDQQVFNAPQPSINFDPFSSFNVEPSPAFSFPDPVVNPMMQPVPVLGQQSFNVPQPAPQFNFNPVTEADLAGTDGMSASQIVDMINQPGYETPSFVEPQISSGPDFSGAGVSLSPFTEGLLDSLKRGVTQPQFGMMGIDPSQNPYGDFATTRPDGTKFYQDEVKQPAVIPMVSDVEESTGSAALNTQSAQELSRLMEGAGNNSPQANFLAEKAKGDLTSKQIADANAFAKSKGTTFDPELGYSRAPFLESQAVQPQVTQEQLQQLASPKRIAPMGRDATKARIAQVSGLNAPATLNQAVTNNPNAVMSTDAQGRIRSFASPQAVQQNLTNAQTSFDQASRDRLTRLEQRDVRPGETITERDTRIADSRTVGADRGGEMSFAEARKFIPKGAKETTKAYNERVKAFQAQQNSTINKLKEEYEQYRANGQKLNNDRTNAYIANYQQTEPEKYGETYKVAQEMLNDGILKDKTQMAMYVIDTMGGKSSDIFDPVTQFMGGGNGAFNPSQLSPQDREAYNFAIENPGDERSQKILDKLGAN